MKRRQFVALGIILTCLLGGAASVDAVTLDDFARVLESIPVSNGARILAAVDVGLKSSCCGFPANETYRLFERVASTTGSASDKEAILLVIAAAIEEGLPIDNVLNKANEGLARGISLTALRPFLAQRMRLLEECRDLFFSRGIFRATPGVPVAAGASALPASRFDALLSNTADALGDYLESNRSPFDSQTIYNEVQARLALLSTSVLDPADVELFESRVTPQDLEHVLVSVVS